MYCTYTNSHTYTVHNAHTKQAKRHIIATLTADRHIPNQMREKKENQASKLVLCFIGNCFCPLFFRETFQLNNTTPEQQRWVISLSCSMLLPVLSGGMAHRILAKYINISRKNLNSRPMKGSNGGISGLDNHFCSTYFYAFRRGWGRGGSKNDPRNKSSVWDGLAKWLRNIHSIRLWTDDHSHLFHRGWTCSPNSSSKWSFIFKELICQWLTPLTCWPIHPSLRTAYATNAEPIHFLSVSLFICRFDGNDGIWEKEYDNNITYECMFCVSRCTIYDVLLAVNIHII